MKNGMKRRVMAVMLAVMMVTLQSGTAFAAEGKDPVSGDQIIGEGAAEAPAQEKEDGTSVSADEKPEPESGETAPGTDEPVSGDAVSGDTIGEGSGEDPAGEQVSDDGISEIVSDDTVSDGSLPFGLKGMPEGYSLSEKQVEGKKNITGHDVLSIMDTLTAGEDYVADEVIFSCDDPEYAKIVAEAYNGTLKSCELGVAVIKLDTDRVTVKEAVTAGADITTTLPPVDANYLTKLTDPIPSEGKIWENSDPFDDAGIMAAKKKAIDKLTWSYWKDRFKDPGLDPGATFTDIYNGGITKSCYQWMHEAVGSYAAWGMTRGEGVTVAVLDSGVYADHPDLAGQVTTRKVGDFEPVDVTGHGTHVAGIIGASSNTVGGVGIAPGAKILSYPIFQGLSATYDAQAMAINDVANNGEIRAQVINMSIGGPVYSQTVQDAINKAYNAGITICVAMGNEHASDIEYPAACDNVIAVSAMDESWQKSDFSTFGPWADIAAPGTAIYSTWNGHTTENTGKDMVLWASMNGTSMACPVVAGVCALYISAKGGTADPDEVEKAIKKTATKVSSPYRIGAGMINAENLLKPLEDTVAPLIALPETVSANQAITFGSTAKGGTLGYIYTVNGKKPNASLGDVKEGFYVEAGDDGTAKVSIAALLDNGLPAGEAGKIMVSRITGLGTMTDPAEQSITVAGGATAGMSITGSNVLAKGKSLTYKLNR
ncbi:MAG: S8 family serine peptidase, partial [Lachnospiraceae bacterium]|nr:S8 family serine peptidase [Lachnospiraceae bacterium]